MTVTPDNLGGVADVVRWLVETPTPFFMISFQPIAQVGRTEAGLGDSVTVDALWREIARGVHGTADDASVARLLAGQKWLGHPACNRFVHGVVARRAEGTPRFHAVRMQGDAMDERVVDGFLDRFGGVSFRQDRPAVAAARMLGLLLRAPTFVARHLWPYSRHWLRRLGEGSAWRGAYGLLTGAVRPGGLLLVSHHFMSAPQLATPLGRERLAQCVFHVPLDGALVPMCEVNALGGRERYYATLRRARGAAVG
jgi:hypothetical protein